DQLAELFEDEWRRAILREGLRRLEESRIDKTTLAVFQAVTLDAREVAEVAAEYGMSANAVYLAKFRCLERLRGVLSLVEGEWV
ncbi:MAG: hypothetical protein O2816_19510, partial [Planctomycetota bacterium]|nr:hypothetical protein [Planctomycetota bacterium]